MHPVDGLFVYHSVCRFVKKKKIMGLYAVLSLDVSLSSSRLVAGPRGVKLGVRESARDGFAWWKADLP